MKAFFKQWNNVWFQMGTAFLINIITWLIIYFQIRPSDQLIPLHYNVFYGTDFVGKGYYIYIIPLVGLCILILNYLLYRHALSREPFAARILTAVSLVVQVFILIAILFLKSVIII